MGERRPGLVLVVVATVLSIPAPVSAQTEIDWSTTEPLTGAAAGGELRLDIAGAGVHPLIVLDEPGVGPPRFRIDGTIRHADVQGAAYLEMWTVLADESRYFTRTLAESGPLGVMVGSAGPRPFSLPFELGDGGPVPARLEINLVTEGPGRFWIGPLTIVSADDEPVTTTTETTPTTDASEGPSTTVLSTMVPATTPATTAVTTAGAVAADTPVESATVWIVVGALAAIGATAAGWLTVARRRRAREQGRIDALDSLRS